MAHAKIQLNITPEWVKAHAEREPESGITSAGGLPSRAEKLASSTMREAGRLSFARFIELSRRKMRLTLEQLADKADIELSALYGAAHGETVSLDPRGVFKLARVLNVDPEPLAELAGLMSAKDSDINEV